MYRPFCIENRARKATLLPAVSLALLVADNAASQSADTSTGKSAPSGSSTRNGSYTRTAKRAKRGAAGNTLLGLAHIGAAHATGKHDGQQAYNQSFLHGYSPESCYRPKGRYLTSWQYGGRSVHTR